MSPQERQAYYRGAVSMFEGLAIRLHAPTPITIVEQERDHLVRPAVIESQAYLYELLDWVIYGDDETPPPHPRIRRVFQP